MIPQSDRVWDKSAGRRFSSVYSTAPDPRGFGHLKILQVMTWMPADPTWSQIGSDMLRIVEICYLFVKLECCLANLQYVATFRSKDWFSDSCWSVLAGSRFGDLRGDRGGGWEGRHCFQRLNHGYLILLYLLDITDITITVFEIWWICFWFIFVQSLKFAIDVNHNNFSYSRRFTFRECKTMQNRCRLLQLNRHGQVLWQRRMPRPQKMWCRRQTMEELTKCVILDLEGLAKICDDGGLWSEGNDNEI